MPALAAATVAVAAAAAAWALRAAVWACLAASAMLVAEAAYMGLASLVAAAAARLWRRTDRRRRRRCRWEPMPGCGGGDVEAGPAAAAEFPMVLVQIPMYNEREVSRRLRLRFGISASLCKSS
jgi:beta-mannan synthase